MGSTKPVIDDGIVVYFNIVRDDDTLADDYHVQVVDDTSLPGKTLAARRIILMVQGTPLKKLSKAVFFLGDLIKLAKPYHWFIDSVGQVFNYRKQGTYKLVFRRITKLIPIPSGGAILTIESFNERFKCLYKPKLEEHFAGILQYGITNILYGVYTEKHKDTHRKI